LRTITLSLLIAAFAFGYTVKAQKPDSLFFNLYTDSLKKGTHNYINVDGKFSNGQWLPLTTKHLTFSSTGGKFEENSLFIDKDFKEDSVTITVALKNDNNVRKTITIYIKKKEDNEKLKTDEEILKEIDEQARKRKKKS